MEAGRQCEVVSSGASAHHNEDWVGGWRSAAGVDLVVIDGGTSVADRDYIDSDQGDVVWFVTRFAAALGTAIDAGLDQQDATQAAIDAAYGEFLERSAGQDVPVYAWPIAALTWVRARPAAGGARLQLYCLGDCKFLLRAPDGTVRDLDPFVNPQEAVLRAEIAKLIAEGVGDGAARQARLLPILRARREFQNTVAHTNSLCLRPNGTLGARSAEIAAPAGSSVLGMTDGFYRLVDTYGLHTPESLFALCEKRGLEAALDELRRHEAAQVAAALSVKRADDASAILWRVP